MERLYIYTVYIYSNVVRVFSTSTGKAFQLAGLARPAFCQELELGAWHAGAMNFPQQRLCPLAIPWPIVAQCGPCPGTVWYCTLGTLQGSCGSICAPCLR